MGRVASYTSLDIELAKNDSFKVAQKCLSEKAMRALFESRSMLKGAAMGAQAYLKVFDRLAKSEAVYGSKNMGCGLPKL